VPAKKSFQDTPGVSSDIKELWTGTSTDVSKASSEERLKCQCCSTESSVKRTDELRYYADTACSWCRSGTYCLHPVLPRA